LIYMDKGRVVPFSLFDNDHLARSKKVAGLKLIEIDATTDGFSFGIVAVPVGSSVLCQVYTSLLIAKIDNANKLTFGIVYPDSDWRISGELVR